MKKRLPRKPIASEKARDYSRWCEPVRQAMAEVMREAQQGGSFFQARYQLARAISTKMNGQIGPYTIERVLAVIERQGHMTPKTKSGRKYSAAERRHILDFYNSFGGRKGARKKTIRRFGIDKDTLDSWLANRNRLTDYQ